MKHLTLLLPFGLPPTDTAEALIREVRAPALAMLLTRCAGAPTHSAVDPFARALAHETWLARQLGLATDNAAGSNGSSNSAHGRKGGSHTGSGSGNDSDSSPAVALAAMAALGLPQTEGYWFIVQPAHIHVARDHLVLTGMRQLSVTAAESRALFDTAQPLFAEAGMPLLYGSADMWFMRADAWRDLSTATPDAASGRNIDIWMPKDRHHGAKSDIKGGSGSARAWRKLQNEIQMHWFTDPVNETREAAGHKPVNSLWLWGGAGVDPGRDTASMPPAQWPYGACFNLPGWIAPPPPRHVGNDAARPVDATQVIDSRADSGLLLLDALIEPGLTNEWTYWLERIETLETDWFAPLLAALRAGGLDGIRLVLTGQDRQLALAITRASLRKFWQKPSLQRLAS